MDGLTEALIATGIGIVLCAYTCFVCAAYRQLRKCVRVYSEPTAPLCYVCCDLAPDALLVPCGHGGLCHQCVRRQFGIDRRCPLCRRGVHGVVLC